MKTAINEDSPSSGLSLDSKNPNERMLQELFDKFNKKYFDSKLPHYHIKLVDYISRRLYKAIGMTYHRQKLIRVVNSLNEKEMISTLLHEMTHVATPGSNHGKRFMKKMEELRNAGAPVDEWEFNPPEGPERLTKSFVRITLKDVLHDLFDIKKITDLRLNKFILYFINNYGYAGSCADFFRRYPWIRRLFKEVKKDCIVDIQFRQQLKLKYQKFFNDRRGKNGSNK